MNLRFSRRIASGLAALLAAGLVWLWFNREPVYQGKPISFWIEHIRNSPDVPTEAFTAMGEQAVPYLMAELRRKESRFVSRINSLCDNLPASLAEAIPRLNNTPPMRQAARLALEKIGQPAIPALIAGLNDRNPTVRFFVRLPWESSAP